MKEHRAGESKDITSLFFSFLFQLWHKEIGKIKCLGYSFSGDDIGGQ